MAFSLLFGALFAYVQVVQANFFSSLFSGQAYAETNSSGANLAQSESESKSNSQVSLALEAKVSPVLVLQDKKDKDKNQNDTTGDNTAGDIANDANISDNALISSAGPMEVLDEAKVLEYSSDNLTSVYRVRSGDTWSQIAEIYDVTVNTILWANDKKKGDILKEGDILFIPPISGIEHEVKKGQTCKNISKTYKVDESDIINYNNLEEGCKLAVGTKLFIPNGQKAEESNKPVVNLSASIAKDRLYYESHPLQNLAGYYINPVPGYRKSQGLHDNNGVDLAISPGTPIHAAAAGTVILARTGYNGGFGNLTVISHPNGTETLYAHQSAIATSTGEQVSQGQVIGYVGSTGRSTGPHLHFEVHGARNPGTDSSWANKK